MRESSGQLGSNKLDTTEETGAFIETYRLPKLSQEEASFYKPITRSETESAIVKTPCKQKSRTGQLHWINRGFILIFLKPSQKTEEEGTTPRSLYDATVSLIPKLDKATKKKKIYR